MKVTKRLSDYITLQVDSKIPITDTCATERVIYGLVSVLAKEFVEKVKALRDEFLKEAEEKYPQLKYLKRSSSNEFALYTICGSDFEKYNRELERKEFCKRKAVQERVVLRLELSNEELSLDDIDLIIEAEIAKATMPTKEDANENN